MNSVLRGLVTVVAPLLVMTAAPPAASRDALAVANPTLKGNLVGELSEEGVTVLGAAGNLTLMGRVQVYGEFVFVPAQAPASAVGTGIAAIVAASGDVLVANVLWHIDARGKGDLEFRWPGVVTFSDGTTLESSGRFETLPFAGLRGISTTETSGGKTITRITMTGQIVDPDPLD